MLIKEKCRQRFKPVVYEINKLLATDEERIVVAIDGMCASGKTTLAYYLSEVFDCNIFHMDDFFLQSHQRTDERMSEIGGNVDYERFKQEVIEPLCKMQDVVYRPYRCDLEEVQPGIKIPFKRLNIIEGSYSHHPYFGDVYNLKVFTKIEEDMQVERIRERNGEEMLERFITEWIPKENNYFKKFGVENADIIIEQTKKSH